MHEAEQYIPDFLRGHIGFFNHFGNTRMAFCPAFEQGFNMCFNGMLQRQVLGFPIGPHANGIGGHKGKGQLLLFTFNQMDKYPARGMQIGILFMEIIADPSVKGLDVNGNLKFKVPPFLEVSG